MFYDKAGVDSRIHNFRMHFNDKYKYIDQRVDLNNFELIDTRKKNKFWQFIQNITSCKCNHFKL